MIKNAKDILVGVSWILFIFFKNFLKSKKYLQVDLQNILFNAFSLSHSDIYKLFNKIDKNKDGLITYDEFKLYALEKPEYARIFLTYHELKTKQSHNKNDDDDQLFVSCDLDRYEESQKAAEKEAPKADTAETKKND